jgi:hypothetical protein
MTNKVTFGSTRAWLRHTTWRRSAPAWSSMRSASMPMIITRTDGRSPSAVITSGMDRSITVPGISSLTTDGALSTARGSGHLIIPGGGWSSGIRPSADRNHRPVPKRLLRTPGQRLQHALLLGMDSRGSGFTCPTSTPGRARAGTHFPAPAASALARRLVPAPPSSGGRNRPRYRLAGGSTGSPTHLRGSV